MSKDKLSNMEFVDLVVDLAQDVESTDSIDWAMFPANEEDLYKMAATQVIESLNMIEDKDDKIMLLLATTVKLVVENTVLNHQLLSKNTSF
jgi:hypothetical protein